MLEINKRFIVLRKELGLSQRKIGESIGLSNSGISNIENGIRSVTEQHIKLLCAEFDVNEEWLRTGEGEMFVAKTSFSLDDYAKQNKLSSLEIDIIKSYMEVDPSVRKGVMNYFKDIFSQHSNTTTTQEDEIEEELERYRRELEAEKKGITSSATDGSA